METKLQCRMLLHEEPANAKCHKVFPLNAFSLKFQVFAQIPMFALDRKVELVSFVFCFYGII